MEGRRAGTAWKEAKMQTFKVDGMTCAHCERAVTAAIQSVDPQARVTVHLASGTVAAETAAPADIVVRAIEAEGYQVRHPATSA
jgi:copper chaperone